MTMTLNKELDRATGDIGIFFCDTDYVRLNGCRVAGLLVLVFFAIVSQRGDCRWFHLPYQNSQ